MKSALRKRDMDISELQERLSGLEQTMLESVTLQYSQKLETLQSKLSYCTRRCIALPLCYDARTISL